MSTCRTPESKLRTRVSKLRTLVSILRTTVSIFRTFVAGPAPETIATAATCWLTAGVPSSHASHAVILHDTNRSRRVVVGWMVESPNAGGQTRSSRQRRSVAILPASNRPTASGVWSGCVASKPHKGQELESKSIWIYGDGPGKGLRSRTVRPLVVTAPDLARLLSACAHNTYGFVRSSRPLLSAGRHSGIGVSNGPRSCQFRTSESVSRTTISIARTSVSAASGPNAGPVGNNDELARSHVHDASSVATSDEGRATGPRVTASDHGAGGPARRTPRAGRGGLDPWRSRPETELRARSPPIACPLVQVVHKVLATQDLTAESTWMYEPRDIDVGERDQSAIARGTPALWVRDAKYPEMDNLSVRASSPFGLSLKISAGIAGGRVADDVVASEPAYQSPENPCRFAELPCRSAALSHRHSATAYRSSVLSYRSSVLP